MRLGVWTLALLVAVFCAMVFAAEVAEYVDRVGERVQDVRGQA